MAFVYCRGRLKNKAKLFGVCRVKTWWRSSLSYLKYDSAYASRKISYGNDWSSPCLVHIGHEYERVAGLQLLMFAVESEVLPGLQETRVHIDEENLFHSTCQ